ncbi:MAG: hypothetical protein QOI02_563, partial [Actinomycetota bacterium]|nr:hypothetical protein [Actinomycetota bacterium]
MRVVLVSTGAFYSTILMFVKTPFLLYIGSSGEQALHEHVFVVLLSMPFSRCGRAGRADLGPYETTRPEITRT